MSSWPKETDLCKYRRKVDSQVWYYIALVQRDADDVDSLKRLFYLIVNARTKLRKGGQQWQPSLPDSVKQRLKKLQKEMNQKHYANKKKKQESETMMIPEASLPTMLETQKRKSEGDDCLLKISTEVYQQWVKEK